MVQRMSEPGMPMGISRLGFLASCAAVDTASNPMYAKKMTPAPRRTPDHPNEPKVPVFSGRKGCQLMAGSSGWWSRVALPGSARDQIVLVSHVAGAAGRPHTGQ